MLDIEWVLNTLKEARDDENWELIREVIVYLDEDDLLEIFKQDEDWSVGTDEND